MDKHQTKIVMAHAFWGLPVVEFTVQVSILFQFYNTSQSWSLQLSHAIRESLKKKKKSNHS